MKFYSSALIASTASAFAPSNSFTRLNKNGFAYKTQQQPRLRLFPDPYFGNEMTNLVTESAVSSSSITTSNFIESLVSNVAGFVLVMGVGLGVYSTALQEKHSELQNQLNEMFSMETAEDSAAPVVEEPEKAVEVKEPAEVKEAVDVKETVEEAVPEAIESVEEVIIEEMGDITGEVLAAVPVTVSTTSEKVLKETEKAIAEVKAKGVEETKAKMESSVPLMNQWGGLEPAAEPKREVAKNEKDPETKKKIAQGVTLIVAAVGVALARNFIKAWLGRGMF